MTEQQPMTPPPELVGEWLCSEDYLSDASTFSSMTITGSRLQNVATQAARWGFRQCMKLDAAWLEAKRQAARDEELEACCKWLAQEIPEPYISALRAARRPKPLSSKEQALKTTAEMADCIKAGFVPKRSDLDTIRRALEQLDD